ncbi:hypothetical protein N7478_009611 [Penicillium angulare]|uniref:uncharacterized protein n=1 Tax=Penicillium angulare TaxID=116970 RepID=UPI002540AD07|nr:uncharacterized protein N7478_009611 [Penicillium angulare]KAJ5266803.1 hypothetical protein N7478_009611 [Penicillium angulare]
MLPQSNLFTSHDPQYRLPSRVLLETHSIIAGILNISGLLKSIGKTLEYIDEVAELANNGDVVSSVLNATVLYVLGSGFSDAEQVRRDESRSV